MARLSSLRPLALICMVLASPLLANGQVTTAFCRSVVADMATCPQPRNDNTVEIDLYQGKWYQVATTAQWAYGQWNQLGGQCVSANYTVLGQMVPTIDRIQVTNSYLKVLRDRQRALVALISDASRAISMNLRGLCQALLGNVVNLNNMRGAMEWMESYKNHTEFRAHLQAIENQVLAALARSQIIYDALETVQMRNSEINGVSLPQVADWAAVKADILNATATIEFYAKVLNNQRGWANEQAHHVAPHTINPVTRTLAAGVQLDTSKLGQWYRTYTGIISANNALKYAADYIGEFDRFVNYTADFLDNAGEDPRRTARKAEILLGPKPAAPVATMAVSNAVIARRNQEVNKTGLSIEDLYYPKLTGVTTAQGLVVSATGTATQNPIQSGKWSVNFAPLLNYQYWVLKVWGDAAVGYGTALVYSCFSDVTTGNMPQTSLFLLSRSPTVPANVLQRAKNFAATTGIMIGGDNPLITINQDATLCGEV